MTRALRSAVLLVAAGLIGASSSGCLLAFNDPTCDPAAATSSCTNGAVCDPLLRVCVVPGLSSSGSTASSGSTGGSTSSLSSTGGTSSTSSSLASSSTGASSTGASSTAASSTAASSAGSSSSGSSSGTGFDGGCWKFTDQVTYATGLGPIGVVAADFDGQLDLAVVDENPSANSMSILLGNGLGSFGSQTPFPIGGAAPWGVAVGDLNHDGLLDLVATNFANGTGGNTVTVLLGTGGGNFGDPRYVTCGYGPLSVAIADFDEDGRPDLVVTGDSTSSAYNEGITVTVLFNLDGGSFGAGRQFTTEVGPDAVVVDDFNGDGHQDLAVTNSVSDTVSILLGWGDGGFRAQSAFHVQNYPTSVATGDFDHDGRVDLAVSNSGANTVSVLMGLADAGFGVQHAYPVGPSPSFVQAADFNQDGHLDLAVSNQNALPDGGYSASVLLGWGDGGFHDQVMFPVGKAPIWEAVGDFNGDSRPDLAVTNNLDNTVSVLLSSTCN